VLIASSLFFSEGRSAAAEVDAWLSDGDTRLPSAGGIRARVSVHHSKSFVSPLTLEQVFAPPPSVHNKAKAAASESS
jgi:hypothetical protein